ncbi:hypothetical protein BRC81_10310 [Halobacteriales archaeon QS_1_68_20]|nr:MAG: hypothetical protein BRC81_10310 [Halobacteriales archaeon QS_1_68_20]
MTTPVSRRTLLGGVAGIAAGRTLPATATAGQTVTVLTRNLYAGVDLSALFEASALADVRQVAGRMLETVRAHPYAARMEAVAAEIAATRPDVVGLQEAALSGASDRMTSRTPRRRTPRRWRSSSSRSCLRNWTNGDWRTRWRPRRPPPTSKRRPTSTASRSTSD